MSSPPGSYTLCRFVSIPSTLLWVTFAHAYCYDCLGSGEIAGIVVATFVLVAILVGAFVRFRRRREMRRILAYGNAEPTSLETGATDKVAVNTVPGAVIAPPVLPSPQPLVTSVQPEYNLYGAQYPVSAGTPYLSTTPGPAPIAPTQPTQNATPLGYRGAAEV